MDYSHNSCTNENNTMRHGQIHSFYPEFNQKNSAKYVKLNEPYNNHTNNEVNNINYFNNNSIKHNYNSNILIQRKNKNKYKNINIKNFYFFNGNNTCRKRTDNNGIYEEYIIDYKEGLNLNNFGKNNNLYKYNNCSLQNWRNKNKINNTDNPINTNSTNDGINEKELSQEHNNKTYKTYEHFYKVNSKGKKTKLSIDTPYKKIIVNDYSCNNSSKGKISNNIDNGTNNNFKYNYKISKTQRNNTSGNKDKNNKKTLRDKYNSYFNEVGTSENEKVNKYYINNPNKIKDKEISNDYILKRHSYTLKDNLNSKYKNKINENLEIKYKNFVKHFSNYCISYYFEVITKVFNFLKSKNSKKKKGINNRYYTETNFNKRLISSSKQIEIPKLKYGTNYKKYHNKFSERTPLNKSGSALIDRIKSKNQSLSPNSKDECEMFRNIHELRKKHEIINSRKKILNNSNLNKDVNISSKSDLRMVNEFRLTSFEKNKEKWENTKNKERERKKSILENKKIKKNHLEIKTQSNDNIIPRLNEINKAFKNRIKKMENKTDKSIEISMNIGSITIKQKEKININDFSFGDNNKDIEIRKNKYFYDKNALINKEKYEGNNFKKETKRKNRMINIKKITTKDKSIHVNINYMKYSPIKIKKNINNNDINKLYKVCKVFNISIFGDKNGTNFNIN